MQLLTEYLLYNRKENDMADVKVLMKLENKSSRQPTWVHVCYVDKELYENYKATTQQQLNEALKNWAEKTFNKKSVPVSTVQDFAKLKLLVKAHYKTAYPDVYRDSPTDRQGWMRVWVTDMMKEGVKNVSRKESI